MMQPHTRQPIAREPAGPASSSSRVQASQPPPHQGLAPPPAPTAFAAVSPSLLSWENPGTAGTVGSTSFPSTTGSTAAYYSSVPSYVPVDVGTSGGGVGLHDSTASRSTSILALGGATADEAGTASLMSRLRAAAVASRKGPQLLRSHAVTPMLVSSTDMSPYESSSLLASPKPVVTPLNTTEDTRAVAAAAAGSSSPSILRGDASGTRVRPSADQPEPRQVRRCGVPYMRLLQQRCRAAATLAQRLAPPLPPRSPRTLSTAAGSVAPPLLFSAPLPRHASSSGGGGGGGSSASVSPTATPRALSGASSTLTLLVSADPASSVPQRQRHWSKRSGRTSPGLGAAEDEAGSSTSHVSSKAPPLGDAAAPALWGPPPAASSSGEPSGYVHTGPASAAAAAAAVQERHSTLRSAVERSPSARGTGGLRGLEDTIPHAPHAPPTAGHSPESAPLFISMGAVNADRDADETTPSTVGPGAWARRSDVGVIHWAEPGSSGRPLRAATASTAADTSPRGPDSRNSSTGGRRGGQPLLFHDHEPDPVAITGAGRAQGASPPLTRAASSGSAAEGSGTRPWPVPSSTPAQPQPYLFTVAIELPSTNTSNTNSPGPLSRPPATTLTTAPPQPALLSGAGGGINPTVPLLVFTEMPSDAAAAAAARAVDGDVTANATAPQSGSSSPLQAPRSPAPLLGRHPNARPRNTSGATRLDSNGFAAAPVAAGLLPPPYSVSRPFHCTPGGEPRGPSAGPHPHAAPSAPPLLLLPSEDDTAVPPHGDSDDRGALSPALFSPSSPSSARAAAAGAGRAGTQRLSEHPDVPLKRQQPVSPCPKDGPRRVTKGAEQFTPLPADAAVLLVVPEGVASVPASAITAMTALADDVPAWLRGASFDAAFALVEDVAVPTARGSSPPTDAAARWSPPPASLRGGRGASCGDGGGDNGRSNAPRSAASATAATVPVPERVVSYFPVHSATVASRSPFFSMLFEHDGGCGPYVRSTPDEYIDISDCCTATPSVTAATTTTAATSTAAASATPSPALAYQPAHVSRCPPHLRDVEAHVASAGTTTATGQQRVPTFIIPSPASVTTPVAEDVGRIAGAAALPQLTPPPPPPPAFSPDCLCQLLHYLHTGVLPMFHSLSAVPAEDSQSSPTASSAAPRGHLACDYAALLWMGLYTGLSTLTGAMLRLLWRTLALSHDVWPYWFAALQWRVAEMQHVCEAWMEQHLTNLLRTTTPQGLWRGLQLRQVQLLVRLRRNVLEAQARATQTFSAMASDASQRYTSGHGTELGAGGGGGGNGTAGENSATLSTTTATSPSLLIREQLSNSDTGNSASAGGGGRGPWAIALASPVVPIGWPAMDMLGFPRHRLQRDAEDSAVGGAGGTDGNNGEPRTTVATTGTDAQEEQSNARPPSTRPSPVLSQPASPFPSSTTPPPSRPRSPPSPSLVASAAAVRHFWTASGRRTPRGAVTATPGSSSSPALTFDDMNDVDGLMTHELEAPVEGGLLGGVSGRRRSADASTSQQGSGTQARRGGEAASSASSAAWEQAGVLRADLPPREGESTVQQAGRWTQSTTHSVLNSVDEARAGSAGGGGGQQTSASTSPFPGPGYATTTLFTGKPAALYTSSSNCVAMPPTLQLMADGAWRIGGCGRLYTSKSREELEQQQAHWYHAERELQRPFHSSALLTETELLECLWAWWLARREDAQLPPTSAVERRAVAALLREVRLDEVGPDAPPPSTTTVTEGQGTSSTSTSTSGGSGGGRGGDVCETGTLLEQVDAFLRVVDAEADAL